MVDAKALQLMPEGTHEFSPTIRGHPIRHTRAHKSVVMDSTSCSVSNFVRYGSELRSFGEVVHRQAYECLSGEFCGDGGLVRPAGLQALVSRVAL